MSDKGSEQKPPNLCENMSYKVNNSNGKYLTRKEITARSFWYRGKFFASSVLLLDSSALQAFGVETRARGDSKS